MAVLTISIDLTKNEFQIHGLGRNRKNLSSENGLK